MQNTTKNFTFKPKQITKDLLSVLPERARDVLISRYGLGKESEKKTLEAIGDTYGITRERVRQIENYGISSIRKSNVFKEKQDIFDEIQSVLDTKGNIITEEILLDELAKDKATKNHIHFLLVLGDAFIREKESSEFNHRWYVDKDIAETVHTALRKIYSSLSDNDLMSEPDLIKKFLGQVSNLSEQYKNEEIIKRWLTLSRKLDKNPLGEWGVASSPNVRAKGMRDYAYLVIKRHGSPMHFTEVAEAITQLFNRPAHVATCHNELIKDKRFVLVGRGLYALSEWGYSTGVVKDVISEILKKHGALSREDIVNFVKKERYVKDNTIFVNLQDTNRFGRDAKGYYILVK